MLTTPPRSPIVLSRRAVKAPRKRNLFLIDGTRLKNKKLDGYVDHLLYMARHIRRLPEVAYLERGDCNRSTIGYTRHVLAVFRSNPRLELSADAYLSTKSGHKTLSDLLERLERHLKLFDEAMTEGYRCEVDVRRLTDMDASRDLLTPKQSAMIRAAYESGARVRYFMSKPLPWPMTAPAMSPEALAEATRLVDRFDARFLAFMRDTYKAVQYFAGKLFEHSAAASLDLTFHSSFSEWQHQRPLDLVYAIESFVGYFCHCVAKDEDSDSYAKESPDDRRLWVEDPDDQKFGPQRQFNLETVGDSLRWDMHRLRRVAAEFFDSIADDSVKELATVGDLSPVGYTTSQGLDLVKRCVPKYMDGVKILRAYEFLPVTISEGGVDRIRENLSRAAESLRGIMCWLVNDIDHTGSTHFKDLWVACALQHLIHAEDAWIRSRDTTREDLSAIVPPAEMLMNMARAKTVLSSVADMHDMPPKLLDTARMCLGCLSRMSSRFEGAVKCVVFLNKFQNSEFDGIAAFVRALSEQCQPIMVDMAGVNTNLVLTVDRAEELSAMPMFGSHARDARKQFKMLDEQYSGELRQEAKHRYIHTLASELSVLDVAVTAFVGEYMPDDAAKFGAVVQTARERVNALDDINRE